MQRLMTLSIPADSDGMTNSKSFIYSIYSHNTELLLIFIPKYGNKSYFAIDN